MNKAELVESLAHRTGLSLRESRVMIDAIFDPDPAVGAPPRLEGCDERDEVDVVFGDQGTRARPRRRDRGVGGPGGAGSAGRANTL